jgi:hypothetical protein
LPLRYVQAVHLFREQRTSCLFFVTVIEWYLYK